LAAKFDRQNTPERGRGEFHLPIRAQEHGKAREHRLTTLKSSCPTTRFPRRGSDQMEGERAKLVAHLAQFSDDDAAIKHPFFGLLSPRDMFILEEKHQDYHVSGYHSLYLTRASGTDSN